MPDWRHFRIEDPALIALVKVGQEQRDAKYVERQTFLDLWGSKMIVQASGLTQTILGLADPREFDPPKPLPRGWRKMRGEFAGYVEPTTMENRSMLRALSYPTYREAQLEIMEQIVDASPGSGKLLDYEVYPTRTNWLFDHEGKLYSACITIKNLETLGVFVSIPNPSLHYHSLPGMVEIKYFELQQACATFNQAETSRPSD
jgi:hypothetical protein